MEELFHLPGETREQQYQGQRQKQRQPQPQQHIHVDIAGRREREKEKKEKEKKQEIRENRNFGANQIADRYVKQSTHVPKNMGTTAHQMILSTI